MTDDTDIEPGQIYRHYKGTEYKVLQLATEVAEVGESFKKVVVYQDLSAPEKIWVRSLDIFQNELDVKGEKVKRFARVV